MLVNEIRLKFYLTDSDIYEYYFGNFVLDKKYKSPFRKDPNPSFIFGLYKDRVTWKDFGLFESKGSDGIAFVCQLYGLEREEAIQLIWEEMVKGGNIPKRKRTFIKKQNDLRIEHREISEDELYYWKRAFIKPELLDFFNIKAVAQATLDNSVLFESTKEDPAYAYLFQDSFKTYRPVTKNKSKKFRGKGNGNTIEGWDQLPENADHLIITKSLKDVVVLRNMGYLAVSPPSENNIIPIIKNKDIINNRFNKVVILFDNDPTGIANAEFLNKETGWEVIFLTEQKDCYDTVIANNGYGKLKEFFKKFNFKKYRI